VNRYALDEGIVLQSREFGEIDRLVTLFTRKRGKLRVLAKGARKVGNRFGASLDFFSLSEFLFYTASGMPLVVQGKIRRTFRGLLRSPLRWMAGEYLLLVVERSFPLEKREERILDEVLSLWEMFLKDEKVIKPLLLRFYLDVAWALGIFPELRECVQCRKTLKGERCLLSVPLGGLVCASCGHALGEGTLLPSSVVCALLGLAGVPLEDVAHVPLEEKDFESLDILCAEYLSYHGEHRIPGFVSFVRRGVVPSW
jgi:DNA repair protein RecO (recombination protein O)